MKYIIIFYLKILHVLLVFVSVYLNRHVFVMETTDTRTKNHNNRTALVSLFQSLICCVYVCMLILQLCRFDIDHDDFFFRVGCAS